ncbi:hypothetical protein WAF17_02320 [Bernardetia sp. ABR2-2B]|uniref:hypothetical protein n=1 Tax=Bernardetia sp. ABR2-2B TaxID=3127472 RepID=UPI0030CE1594
MLFINKPTQPRRLVKFYAQLNTEFKNCKISAERIQDCNLNLTLFDETLIQKNGNEPSLNLLRELDFIQRSDEVKLQIAEAVTKILRKELLKRVTYFAHLNNYQYG